MDNNPFIVANTIPLELNEIREKHIIPVFSKDNTPLISQSQIVDTTFETLLDLGYELAEPEIRVSHPIMGRIPEARNKQANELLPHEVTLYYERMMFLLKIPKITSRVDGKDLSLVVGGIKSYSWDNLGRNHMAVQHFKFFVGFQVWVCSNLCVSSDGAVLELKASSAPLISAQAREMMRVYEPEKHLNWLSGLENYSLNASQFAHFIGRCSMQPYDENAPEMALTSSQLSSVVKGYYADHHFSHNQGDISLWNLYNLVTEANKSSYIVGFLDRGVTGEKIMEELKISLEMKTPSWYLGN
ncbi:MAG: DUF3871 family protein [Saprospiraceae bacterium]|nr:DUF3871 family protein [Saprospiraceae bacterium]